MKIQTYSVVVGNEACNAKCPYCVSKMTGIERIKKVNWRNFDIGCKFARANGVSTVLLTGKGEPTLFPSLVSQYVKKSSEMGFSFIELQTNGYNLLSKEYEEQGYLQDWYTFGLTTVCLSIAHYDDDCNNSIFQFPKSLDIKAVIKKLHDMRFSVRLSCVMVIRKICSMPDVEALIDYAKENNVEQLTIRPMSKPDKSEDASVADWVEKHAISNEGWVNIKNLMADRHSTELMRLAHGAIVYDRRGQNICLSNCLTLKPEERDEIRQLIFFPDGHLRYDWCNKGAILL